MYRPLALPGDDRERLVELLKELRARGGEFDTERSDDRIAKLDRRS